MVSKYATACLHFYIQYIYKEITESLEAAVDDEAARELNLSTHGVTSLKYVGFKFIYRVHRSAFFFMQGGATRKASQSAF